MKRSKGNVLYSNPGGYELAKQGLKTCTSRYGIRTELKPGDIALFTNNDTKEHIHVVITAVEYKKLCEISVRDAWAINNYSKSEARRNFELIYSRGLGKNVDDLTDVTLVWFRRED